MQVPDLRSDPKARTVNKLEGRFKIFARIGRWGTCVDCPNDGLGNIYPELCVHTDRYDHHLTMSDLAESFDSELKRQEEAKKQLGDQYRWTKC